jgi:hypothetical protein
LSLLASTDDVPPPVEPAPVVDAPAVDAPVSVVVPSAFDGCVQQARTGAPIDVVAACLDAIIAADPTGEGRDARAARTMLDALASAPPPVVAAAPPAEAAVPPGRLELVGVAGLFGVWNAIAFGLSAQSLSESTNGGLVLLGTSALALGAGVGFGYAGNVLGERMRLDEGGGRLVASGLVWGSNMEIATSVLLLDVVKPEGRNTIPTALAPVVAFGFVGGGVGLLAAKFIPSGGPSGNCARLTRPKSASSTAVESSARFWAA